MGNFKNLYITLKNAAATTKPREEEQVVLQVKVCIDQKQNERGAISAKQGSDSIASLRRVRQ